MKNGNFSQNWVDIDSFEKSNGLVDPDVALLSLGFTRTYNSRSSHNGLFGRGWCSPLETRLDFLESGAVQLTYCGAGVQRRFGTPQLTDDVRRHADDLVARLRTQSRESAVFSKMYAGTDEPQWSTLRETLLRQEYLASRLAKTLTLKPPDFGGRSLGEMGVGRATLIFHQDEIHLVSPEQPLQTVFDRDGRFIGLRHRDGGRIDIAYDADRPVRIEDGKGRSLVFTYRENRRIATATQYLASGEKAGDAAYEYDAAGDVVSARNAWKNRYGYHYGSRRTMTRVDWPDKTSIHLNYDNKKGTVISYQDRNGCVENYTYVLYSQLHHAAQVLKRCAGELKASGLYEVWYGPRNDGKQVLQRVRSFVKDLETDIAYEPRFEMPVRISAHGVTVTYEYAADGRVASRTAGDTKWVFLPQPDLEGFSVIEDRLYPSGTRELIRHRADPWGTGVLPLMSAAERERQKSVQAEAVRKADEAVAQFKNSSREIDRRLDRWHEMRGARRFESAAALARSLDADFKLSGSEIGRAGLTQVALVLAEELAGTAFANVSLELAEFALQVAREVEIVDAARAALLIDQLSRQFGGPTQAAHALHEAIDVHNRRPSGQDAQVMRALYLALATAERERGNPRLSLAALRALPAEAGQQGSWTAQAIEEVAGVYSEAGLYDLAFQTLLQSKVVFLGLLDPSVQWAADSPNSAYPSVRALGIAESILRAQGRFEDALGVNRIRAQRLFRGAPLEPADPTRNPSYAPILGDEALTLIYTGQYEAASKVLETAFQHVGDDGIRTSLLSTRALLWSRLGLHAQAVDDSREAIRLAGTGSGDDKANLAGSLSQLGRYSEAEAAFEDAFTDATRRLPTAHPNLADLRVMWAEARLRAGLPAAAISVLHGAIDDLQAALGFAHWRVTRALAVRAEAAIELRDIDAATASATRALSSAYAGGLSEWRSTADHVTSRALALSGNNALAIFFAKRAVNELQHVRSQLSGLDAQSQLSLMKARHKVFENAAALLIDAGRIPEAQQVLSMYKLDELQQFTQRNGSEDPRNVQASVGGAEMRWQISIDRSASRLGAVSAELAGLETLLRLGSLDASQARRREQLLDIVDDEQLRFRRAIDAIRLEAETSQRDLERDARTAAERAETTLRSLVSRLSAQSGSQTAALQYIVLDRKVYVLVTTPQLQFSKEIPLAGKSLGQQVQDFRKALADRRMDPRLAGGELHSLLLGQVAPQLEAAGVRNLMISLTGVLRYVPFAALHDGSAYLVERYGIAFMSEAALTLGMQAPQSNWTVAGLGVSAKVDPDFLPLPGVIDEIAAVVRRAPGMASGALPGSAWIDEDFTAERLQHVIRDAPAVIHVASHFRFSPGSDTSSFLLLGDGTRLTLRELMGARYRFGASDLLTLSACETGVDGGRDLAGREVEGLAALAQRQGAPAVLATLWPVVDASTALFMQRFYTLRQQGGLSKSEALRQAQVEIIRAGRAPDTAASPTDVFPRYTHPFFWAPFVLLGNWL